MTLTAKITERFLETVIGLRNVKETRYNFQASCPFADTLHEKGADRNPSFSIHKEKGYWHCFTCHQKGGLVSLIMRVHNVSASEAKDILTGAQSVSIADRARYIDSVKDKLDKSQMAEAATFFVPTQAEFTGQALKYLYKRDIDDTVIEHFKLYYTQDWRCNNRIVFPVYDWRGRVVFWTARYIGNELSLGCPKYYMAPGVRKEVVFNTGVFDKKMYIVEGVFDVIRLWILGIANACGIFGTTLTREQAKMLLSCGVSEVCVMLDGDLAGKRGTEVIYQDYSKYFKMSKIQLDGKDPDSIRSKKEMAAYIESEEF